MKDTMLLCTFITPDQLHSSIQLIKQRYILAYNNVYVLQNLDDPTQLILTYNIQRETKEYKGIKLPTTISVHRKKLSNTLYSINALNMFVAEKYNGKMGPQYKVNWNELQNCILVTAYQKLKIIRTKLQEIIVLDDTLYK